MFGKLLKYECQYYAKTLIWVIVFCLSISLLLMPVQFIEIHQDIELLNGVVMDAQEVETTIHSLTTIPVFCTIVIGLTLCAVLAVVRFYKNLFSSEGYLTFSLPVQPMTHVTVKFLMAMAAFVVMTIVSIACVSIVYTKSFTLYIQLFEFVHEILVHFIHAVQDVTWQELITSIQLRYALEDVKDILDDIEAFVNIGQIFGNMVVYSIGALFYCYFSIVVGQAIYPKHRILASVGVFVLGHILLQVIQSILSFGFVLIVWTIPMELYWDNVLWILVPRFVIFFIHISVIVFYWFTIRYILKNHLNLE